MVSDMVDVALSARFGYAINTDVPLGLPLVKELSGCRTILDVGCGFPQWSWTRLIGVKRTRAGVGLDRWRPPPSGDNARIWGSYVIGTGTNLPFADNAFDAVIALDFIEHLATPDALHAISEMMRVASRRVIVLTPNGFLPQEPDQNPWQRHLSGWTIDDLKRLGFSVRGVRGLGLLRGVRATPVVRPLVLGLVVSALSIPVARILPDRSFQILGTWSK